jgi:ABC-2 type transport system permease protein
VVAGEGAPQIVEACRKPADGVAADLPEGDATLLRLAGGYAVATFFLFIAAFFFAPSFVQYAEFSMRSAMQPQMGQTLNATENILRPLTYNMAVVLLFFIPMLTMRLFAEEKRSGTMELLLTYPLRDGEVLAGKFLAALCLYALILALTLFYPATVAWFTKIEWGAVLTGYLGLLLIGGAFLAIGLFVSSTTENQIVAGFGTFGALLSLWLLGGSPIRLRALSGPSSSRPPSSSTWTASPKASSTPRISSTTSP